MNEIKQYDAQFSGSKSGGSFTINTLGSRFEGNFQVTGNVVEWQIDKKPFFVPCSVIENFLKNHIK
ncbi:hypothetical protein [Pedobacter frigidisoli]|uniref:hypothetical protein n=1 Tax=Pedobacter frigidisoli TaxID=2530455 RepID=UPI002930E3EC|nr:hypothetical protein [Pedobacter frigidisoli]